MFSQTLFNLSIVKLILAVRALNEYGIEQTKVKENKSSDILHGWSSSMHLSNTHILVASVRLDLTKGKNINKEDRYDLSYIWYIEN